MTADASSPARGTSARVVPLADAPELRLVPLGVGNSFPSYHYSTSLAMVSPDGSWVLIDCPHPIAKMAAEASETSRVALDFEKLAGVIITHIHADHCSGLESLVFYFRYTLGRRLSVAAHPLVLDALWAGHLAAAMEHPVTPWWQNDDLDAPPAHDPLNPVDFCEQHALADYCDITLLDETTPVAFVGFEVECRQTLHVVPTTAVSVRLDGSGLFAYSADTTFDPELITWLARADRFAHDVGPGIHAHYDRLASLDAGLRRRMWFVHYPDDLVNMVDPAAELLVQGGVYPIVPPTT